MPPLDRPVLDAVLRKTRGAFFTPHALCRYVTEWAVRDAKDEVLEPSCGEAGFLLAAGERLAALNPGGGRKPGHLAGVEVHQGSARLAEAALREAGHEARIEVGDFFTVEPRPIYDAVIGNPPYVRYQSFTGGARARSRRAALRAGVALTALASSWAALAVHAALFLKRGGRLGLVLPAELLSVNYAAEVRRFLMEKFRTVRLVVFAERVFPGVLEEIVLLLADGFEEGPASHCELYQARNMADLDRAAARQWRPSTPGGKWTPSLLTAGGLAPYEKIRNDGRFTTLQHWGETTLGMVTRNNRYFTMSPASAARHGIGETELVRISPPGSRHLRGLALTQVWPRLTKPRVLPRALVHQSQYGQLRPGHAVLPLQEPVEPGDRLVQPGPGPDRRNRVAHPNIMAAITPRPPVEGLVVSVGVCSGSQRGPVPQPRRATNRA